MILIQAEKRLFHTLLRALLPSTGGLGQPAISGMESSAETKFFSLRKPAIQNANQEKETPKKEDFDHNMLLNKEKQTVPKEEEKAEFCTEPIGSMCKRPVLVRPGRRAYPNWLREPSKHPQPHSKPALPCSDRLSNFHHYKVRHKQITNDSLEKHKGKQHTSTVSWEQGSTLQIGNSQLPPG